MSSHTFYLPLDPAYRLRIDFNYSPARPDVYYLPNGDPGYPGDPEEFDLAIPVLEARSGNRWSPTGFPMHVLDGVLDWERIEDAARDFLEADASRAADEYHASREAD